MQDLKQMFVLQEPKLDEEMQKVLKENPEFELSDFSQARGINSRYGMKSFSAERKDRVNDWKRPAIYPHV